MPNFHMHWLVALQAAESFPEEDDILLGKKKYLAYHKTFRESVYAAIRSAKSMADFRAAFKKAAEKLDTNLHTADDYDAITCFSAYMLGACGPDFWTLMSKLGILPSADGTAGIHFDFGHYNRTHHQFTISGNRLRTSREWTLDQRAERAYFAGMATHFAADLVMHELVNVYAGAYNILEKAWISEHGISSYLKKLWSTHNKVEHFWDTYVRYRWLGDWGTVWSADEAPGGPARLEFPLAETIYRDAPGLNPGLGEEIGRYFLGNESIEISSDLAGPLYSAKKEKKQTFDTNFRYLLERGLIFPRIFCDRVLDPKEPLESPEKAFKPFIYDAVVHEKDGAYPSADVFAEAIKEKTTTQMKDSVRKGLNETNKLKAFCSRMNLDDDFYSFNYQIYFMCPRLYRLQKYGPTLFWEPKALIPFFNAAAQVASRFADAYTSYAKGQGDNIGALGRFWNLDTGLGVEVKNVATSSTYEVRTRIRLPHVTEAANVTIGHQRRDQYLGGKDKQDYDLPKKYSFKPDTPAFKVFDGPTVDKTEDTVETDPKKYLHAIKTRRETGEPPRRMTDDAFFSDPSQGRTSPALSAPTASICSETVIVRPRFLSTRLNLEFEVPIVQLGAQEVTGFALYADHAGASAAPEKYAEHAAKEWLAASKSQCLRFIEHTGVVDDTQVDGERVRFTARVLANLVQGPGCEKLTREIAKDKWNNVIAPDEVKKLCGQNIAVATCRKNVLKQRGTYEFWPDKDFQLYKDLCPTEQVFFTIFALVRTPTGCFDVFTNQKVSRAEYESMRKIRCVGFVPIVLFYVCDASGRAQIDICYIDGLPAVVEQIPADGLTALSDSDKLKQFFARFVDEQGEPVSDFTGEFDHSPDEARDMAFSGPGFARVSDVIGAAWASLSLPAEPTQATQESADARSGLVDALRKRWKEIRGEPDDTWKQREEALLEVQFKEGALSGIVLEAETKQTLMVRPPVTLAQLHGMYFDTDKCFLLPTAAGSLKRLVEICAKHAGCEMLIVGHTDTAGKEAYNLDLSADRADAFKAYLRDDVDAWLAWYKAGVPASKRWGGHEDSLMIDALVPPDCVGSDGPIAAFQEWHNGNSPDARQPDQPRSQPTGWAALKVDGIMGPLTRRQLIIDYMNLDGTSLEPDTRVVTYGCGEFFPLDSVEGEVDESAKDGEHVQFDRRVEVFLFDQPFGILPPVPGVAEGASSDKASKAAKGDKLYPEWRIRSVRKYTIGPGGVQPEEGDLWLRIAVAPVDAAKLEETFVLKSTDGSVVAQKAASKDYEANDEGVDLHFEGLDQGESYTLEVHGDDGLVVVLFKNVAYAELANQAGSGDEPDQPEDVGEEFGEAESVRPSLSGDTVLA